MKLQTYTFKKDVVITGIHAIHYYELPKRFVSAYRQFDAWELVYVDRGTLIVDEAGQSFPLEDGELYLHAPGTPHCLQGNGSKAANVLTVIFPCRSPLLRDLLGKRLRPNTSQRAILKDILRETKSSFGVRLDDPSNMTMTREKDPPIGAEQMIGCYLTTLLVSHLRQVNRPQIERKVGSQPMLDAIVTYMEENLSGKMSLALLSEEFHVSVSYIKRLFSQYKQMGTMKFFTSLKIEQAKKLLRERERNVSQIAEEMGYDNVHYFCNQFKKFTGLSPMEYRKSVNSHANLGTKYKR